MSVLHEQDAFTLVGYEMTPRQKQDQNRGKRFWASWVHHNCTESRPCPVLRWVVNL